MLGIKLKTSLSHHCLFISSPTALDNLWMAKLEFQQLANLWVIHPSDNSWSSPLHMIPKKKKKSKAFSWRLYSNYHRLNSIIFLDYYHISNIQDFTSQLYGATIFSNIDPIQVCHQILVEKIFFKKSWIAIAGHFRLFEFLHLLFKLQKYCRNIPMFSESTSMIRLP